MALVAPARGPETRVGVRLGAVPPVLPQPAPLPPVRLAVTLPPGGSLDVIARKLGPPLAPHGTFFHFTLPAAGNPAAPA